MDVRRYMTRNPVTVGPNDSIRKVRLLMRQGHVRRLPVVEAAAPRRVIGILSRSDLLGAHRDRLDAAHEKAQPIGLIPRRAGATVRDRKAG